MPDLEDPVALINIYEHVEGLKESIQTETRFLDSFSPGNPHFCSLLTNGAS